MSGVVKLSYFVEIGKKNIIFRLYYKIVWVTMCNIIFINCVDREEGGCSFEIFSYAIKAFFMHYWLFIYSTFKKFENYSSVYNVHTNWLQNNYQHTSQGIHAI